MAESQKRLDFIDYVKALGILIVILGHTSLAIEKDNHTAAYFIKVIYSFHMPLFFVVTGLLMGYKDAHRKTDNAPPLRAGKLFLRLMVPYYIYSALYMLVEYFFYGHDAKRIQDMFNSTLTTCGNAPLWFLATMFFVRLLFHLLKYTLKADIKTIMVGSMFASVFAFHLHAHLKQTGFLDDQITRFITISSLRIVPALFFIALGFAYSRLLDLSKKRRNLFSGIVIGVMIMMLVYIDPPSVNMHIFRFKNMLYFLFTGTFGSAALINFCTALPDGIRLLRTIGKDSMDIMMLHYKPMPFMFIAGDVVFAVTGGRNFLLIWLAACVMVIPLTIVYCQLKKLPAMIFKKKEDSTSQADKK